MNIKRIGNRGVYFTYRDDNDIFTGDTSVYLINTDNKIFICDTHMGSKSMEKIQQYIDDNQLNDKEIIVFNSHADWDHIWGNCFFEGSTIIGHELCRKRMEQEGKFDLEQKRKYHNGFVKLKLPNLTFDSRLEFNDDKIEFIYTPGHTIDSSICFDKKESVIFVGDLLEYPIPYTNYHDLEAYLKTLEFIKSLNVQIILSAHSGRIDEKLFDDNIKYIKNLMKENPIQTKDKEYLRYHNFNIKNILMSRYEFIAREKLIEKFDYESFMRGFWNSIDGKYDNLDFEYLSIGDINYEDLEEALKSYISRL